MCSSGKPLQQVRRALAATLVLGGLASLLCLALPLYVLHVLESAIPGASLQTLGLLTLIAAGAAATLVCLLAARDRILLRSGLWLEHTLGRQLLERGERLGIAQAEIKKDADALGLFADALTTRAIAPALDAVWLPLLLAALALLHPIMGAIAALLAAALILVALGQRPRMSRLAGHARDS